MARKTVKLPVHEYVQYTEAPDGQITAAVPWSAFQVVVSSRQAVAEFTGPYLEHLKGNGPEVAVAFAYMETHGQ